MLKRRKISFLIILFFAVTISLSAHKRVENYDPESVFTEAKLLFDNMNYSSAAELFHKYISLTEGQNTQKIVEAKFYEAACSSYMGAGEQLLMLCDHALHRAAQGGIGQLTGGRAALGHQKLRMAERVLDIKQFFRAHVFHLATV